MEPPYNHPFLRISLYKLCVDPPDPADNRLKRVIDGVVDQWSKGRPLLGAGYCACKECSGSFVHKIDDLLRKVRKTPDCL
jgi:hypothetical protein